MLNIIAIWGKICTSVGIIGISICYVALAGVVLCIAGWLIHDAIVDHKFGCAILAVAFCLIVLGCFINSLILLLRNVVVVSRMW